MGNALFLHWRILVSNKETAWDRYKKNLGSSRPWHLLDPTAKIVEDEKYSSRMSICESCPKFIKATKQCKECGCFMNVKSRLEHAECPLGKW